MIINKSRNCVELIVLSVLALVLSSCGLTNGGDPADTTHAQAGHSMVEADSHRLELEQASPIELNPAKGKELGAVYEAFLSPHQEGGEEEDTPELAPDVFKSTAPSVARNSRPSHGHGVVAFTNDLSKAYVHVAIEDVKPEDIVMFHIHCGRPGQLGPIIIDFGLVGNLEDYFQDGVFSLEITNEDIVAAAEHGEGAIAAFTAGCPIMLALPLDKVKTVGGLQFIAEQGELYFNLHTKGQTFFGDIRGQLARVEDY
ncbi:MAG: CHRD domain-containing protein [Anaerolineae bacterium]